VQIVLKWDEYLVLEILETRKKDMKEESIEQKRSEEIKKGRYLGNIVDGHH